MRFGSLLTTCLFVLSFTEAAADMQLSCINITVSPTIDGNPSDPIWSEAPSVRVRDAVAPIDHTLQCAYDNDRIYLLASFPDPTENREHKLQVWDEDSARYRTGPKREDTFVLKWSMESMPVDLTLSSDTPYRADIWYWKSHRTDSTGYADDKHQVYTNQPIARSKKLISASGNRYYLMRRGDEGSSAYESMLYPKFEGDEVPAYNFRIPTGSRSDVQARGLWQKGVWHVEFARARDTGHTDDVQFPSGKRVQFGVSRYEIAGRKRDDRIDEPMFGAGDVGETLELVLESDPLTLK